MYLYKSLKYVSSKFTLILITKYRTYIPKQLKLQQKYKQVQPERSQPGLRTVRQKRKQIIADKTEKFGNVKRSLQQQQRELCHNIGQQLNNWYEGRLDLGIICNSFKFLWNGVGVVCVGTMESLGNSILHADEK